MFCVRVFVCLFVVYCMMLSGVLFVRICVCCCFLGCDVCVVECAVVCGLLLLIVCARADLK